MRQPSSHVWVHQPAKAQPAVAGACCAAYHAAQPTNATTPNNQPFQPQTALTLSTVKSITALAGAARMRQGLKPR